MGAGGTPRLAGAEGQGAAHGLEQFLQQGKGGAGQPRPAGQTVVHEHGGRAKLGVHGNGYAAQIVAVGHDQQGHEADGRVLQGVDGAHEMQQLILHRLAVRIGHHEPQPLGFKHLGRQFQRLNVQQTQRAVEAALVAADGFGDAQAAEGRGRGEGMARSVYVALDVRTRVCQLTDRGTARAIFAPGSSSRIT